MSPLDLLTGILSLMWLAGLLFVLGWSLAARTGRIKITFRDNETHH